MIEDKLKTQGYQVASVESGEKALEHLAANSIDCVLLDLNMPGIGGRETCRQIRSTKAWRDIPVIFLTSESNREITLDAFNSGADDYVLKNTDFDLLLARLLAQLRRKNVEKLRRPFFQHRHRTVDLR